MVKTKSVYQDVWPDDGTRILVMRYWPRGVAKSRVDLWLKELGSAPGDIRAFRKGGLDWPEFRKRYLDGLEEPPAAEALSVLREHAARVDVQIMCSCRDGRLCHRGILAEVLARDGFQVLPE